jgi:hypothetical protein
MPAAIPIALALTAAATAYGAVEQNQQIQHAKGAAQANQTTMDAQLKEANKQSEDLKKQQADAAKAAQGTQENMAQTLQSQRLRALTSGSQGLQSSILTSPLGASTAPTATKTLLGG